MVLDAVVLDDIGCGGVLPARLEDATPGRSGSCKEEASSAGGLELRRTSRTAIAPRALALTLHLDLGKGTGEGTGAEEEDEGSEVKHILIRLLCSAAKRRPKGLEEL